MPKRNLELIDKVWQHIQDHPEQHQQSAWIDIGSCGTAACFAGHTLLMSGYSPSDIMELLNHDGGVRKPAAKLLGLTRMECATLFRGDNTTAMLGLMVKDLQNGEKLLSCNQYEELADDE
jgi:hypothetical protein